MSYELFIGLRYLKAKRKQTFVSLITLISIAGVTVGVTALIVVLAVMNGFKEDLREKILGVTSHVVVSRFDGNIPKYRQAISGAVLRGIEPETASKVINLPRNMRSGSLEELAVEEKSGGTRATP